MQLFLGYIYYSIILKTKSNLFFGYGLFVFRRFCSYKQISWHNHLNLNLKEVVPKKTINQNEVVHIFFEHADRSEHKREMTLLSYTFQTTTKGWQFFSWFFYVWHLQFAWSLSPKGLFYQYDPLWKRIEKLSKNFNFETFRKMVHSKSYIDPQKELKKTRKKFIFTETNEVCNTTLT